MTDMSKMSADQEEAALARPVLAFQTSDADYVNSFIRDLEDPDKRLVMEKLHDWRNYGVAGKAAILFALRSFVDIQRAKLMKV